MKSKRNIFKPQCSSPTQVREMNVQVEAIIDLTVLGPRIKRTKLRNPQAVIDFLRFFGYSPLHPMAIFLYCPNMDCCDEYTCTYFRIVNFGATVCYDFDTIQKYFIDMYNELVNRQIKGEVISETEVERRIINFFANFKPTKCVLAKPIFRVIKIRVSDAVIWLVKYPDELWR